MTPPHLLLEASISQAVLLDFTHNRVLWEQKHSGLLQNLCLRWGKREGAQRGGLTCSLRALFIKMCSDCSGPSTDSDTNSIHTLISGQSNTHHLHAPVLSVNEKFLKQLQTQLPQSHVYVWLFLRLEEGLSTTGVKIPPKRLHHCRENCSCVVTLATRKDISVVVFFGLGRIAEEWNPADCSGPLAFWILPVEKLQVSTKIFQHLLDCATNLAHKSELILEQSDILA